MKVAAIIGGMSRNYKYTYKNFFDMIGNSVDLDIFIFTWSMFEETGNINECLQEVKNIFRPKKIVMSNYDAFSKTIDDRINYFESLPYHRTGNFSLRTGLLAQHYTLKQAYYLIDVPSDYDLIIRYRFDWLPLFTIDWEDVYFLGKDRLLYSNRKIHGLKGEKERINDMFAISNPKHMEVYCSLFDTMLTDVYINDIITTGCFIPEYMMALHLMRNDVPFQGYNFPYEFKKKLYI